MTHRLSVLLVDDNSDLAENLGELVEAEGGESRVVTQGADALAALRERPADLVVSDMRMPGMDGLELLQRVKEGWPQTMVILVSAFASDGALDAARAGGAMAVLSKPLQLASFAEFVSRLVERQQNVPENAAPLVMGELVAVLNGSGGR